MNFSLFAFFNFRKSYGLSGRTLRKLPFLAHAMYLQVNFPRVFIHELSGELQQLQQKFIVTVQYVLVTSLTRFRVNLHSIVA